MIGTGKTDIGIKRETNEDFVFFTDEPIGPLKNLYLVADGMGGCNAGEVASSKASEFFLDYISSNEMANGEPLDFLVSAFSYANKNVLELAKKNPEEFEGMGTTLSVCTISENRLYIVHIGDSRVYIIGGGKMGQLTTDHTYVGSLLSAGKITDEEATTHPKRHMLTKVLGTDEAVEADAYVYTIYENDYVLLCSDGLTNMLSNEDIFNITVTENLSVSQKVDKFIETANAKGGVDNISVVLVSMGEGVSAV